MIHKSETPTAFILLARHILEANLSLAHLISLARHNSRLSMLEPERPVYRWNDLDGHTGGVRFVHYNTNEIKKKHWLHG